MIPDNYQEDRKPLIVDRTSSTNIGLSLLAVISSYDMGLENLNDTLQLLKNIINTYLDKDMKDNVYHTLLDIANNRNKRNLENNNNIYLMFCGDVRIKEFGCENFNEEWNGRIKRYSLNR